MSASGGSAPAFAPCPRRAPISEYPRLDVRLAGPPTLGRRHRGDFGVAGLVRRCLRALADIALRPDGRGLRRPTFGASSSGPARGGIDRTRRCEAHDRPALSRLSHDQAVRPKEHRQEVGVAAPLLPLAHPHGPSEIRSDGRPAGQRVAMGACRGCSTGAISISLLEGPLPPDDEPDWRHRRDDAVLELLYGSGLRVGELCGLDRDSIDFAGAAVVVWGKGAKERRVPLSEPAAAALHRWLADPRGRAARTARRRPGPGAVRERARTPLDPPRRSPHRRSALADADASARAAAQLRHPPARRWRRSASGPGAARSQRRRDHAALHPRQPRAPADRLPGRSSAGMSIVDVDPYLAQQWERWLKRRSSSAR